MHNRSHHHSPIRVLHIVGAMNRGGVETWLMNVMRNIDRDRFSMEFLVHTDMPGLYDDEIRDLGGTVHQSIHPSRPFAWARKFGQVLHAQGPYQVVHSHVHHFTGFALERAYRHSVPGRIAHSHTDTSYIQSSDTIPRRIYYQLSTKLIARYSTGGFAPTAASARSLYGPEWERDGRVRLLPYGIDLTPFAQEVDRDLMRAQLGIRADARVVGHVGRFAAPKNHDFIVEIARAMVQKQPNVLFTLVGDGRQRARIETEVRHAGLERHFLFLGDRSDVAHLLRSVFDVFILPSKWEGLPLAALEAQAAGLPCVLSDAIPEEAVVLPALVERLPIQDPNVWAGSLSGTLNTARPLDRANALELFSGSKYNLRSTMKTLEALYEQYE